MITDKFKIKTLDMRFMMSLLELMLGDRARSEHMRKELDIEDTTVRYQYNLYSHVKK